MKKIDLKLNNTDGLHARAAAVFVQYANKYESDIEIEFEGNRVNGKSIIGVMSLGAFYGEEITIIAKGIDEDKAIEGLSNIITNEMGNA